jgi:hypothetical protein
LTSSIHQPLLLLPQLTASRCHICVPEHIRFTAAAAAMLPPTHPPTSAGQQHPASP